MSNVTIAVRTNSPIEGADLRINRSESAHVQNWNVCTGAKIAARLADRAKEWDTHEEAIAGFKRDLARSFRSYQRGQVTVTALKTVCALLHVAAALASGTRFVIECWDRTEGEAVVAVAQWILDGAPGVARTEQSTIALAAETADEAQARLLREAGVNNVDLTLADLVGTAAPF